MIRRFFDLCDRNKDGLLSVAYFNNYVLGQPNMPEGFRYEQIDVDKVLSAVHAPPHMIYYQYIHIYIRHCIMCMRM